MRKIIFVLCFVTALQAFAQEQSFITIKSGEVNNGVVILSAHQSTAAPTGKAFDLQCNKGASGCDIPKAGTYLMVVLPKNHGMYDCVNVDLYPSSGEPASSQRIGEYCLVEK